MAILLIHNGVISIQNSPHNVQKFRPVVSNSYL